jgi:hypothetical protein
MELWGDIGFLVFTISTLVFSLLYLTSSRWYKSFVAAILALFIISVDLICIYISLRIWDITIFGLDWNLVRILVFWPLGALMLTSVVAFLEIQFGKRGDRWRASFSRRYSDVKEIQNSRKE